MDTIFAPFSINTSREVVQLFPQANPDEKPYTTETKLKLKEPERYGPALGAQLFIGLNVGSRTVWTAEQVRDSVSHMREAQLIQMIEAGLVLEIGSSVRTKLKFWGKVSNEQTGAEPFVSVLIDIVGGEGDKGFIQNMESLAGEIALALKQKTVHCQIHRAGIVQERFDISTQPVVPKV